MPPIRSFIAIAVPPETRSCLDRIAGKLKATTSDVRWVKRDDVHLTLKFLGDVEERRIPEIEGCIEQCIAEIPSFSIAVRDLGAFPSDHNPQIIWIAAEDASGRLAAVQLSLEEGLSRMGFKKEKRSFFPHLTLGRLKSARGKEAVRRGLATLQHADCGAYHAESVCLYKSDLTPGGAVYTLLKSFALLTSS